MIKSKPDFTTNKIRGSEDRIIIKSKLVLGTKPGWYSDQKQAFTKAKTKTRDPLNLNQQSTQIMTKVPLKLRQDGTLSCSCQITHLHVSRKNQDRTKYRLRRVERSFLTLLFFPKPHSFFLVLAIPWVCEGQDQSPSTQNNRTEGTSVFYTLPSCCSTSQHCSGVFCLSALLLTFAV